MNILLIIHFTVGTIFKYIISKLFNLFLVCLSIFEIRDILVSTFSDRLLGEHIYSILYILDLDVSVERHVAHHDADVFWSDEAVIIKVVHIKSEPHLLI